MKTSEYLIYLGFLITIIVVIAITVISADYWVGQTPASYWKFNETSGTSAANEIGYFNLAVNGGEFVAGKLGNAIKFDTAGDYARAGAGIGNFSQNQFTVAFWMKVNNTQQSDIIYHSNGYVTAGGWGISYYQGNVYYQNNGGQQICFPACSGNTGVWSDDQWHRVVFTRSASNNWTMYKDGVPVAGKTLNYDMTEVATYLYISTYNGASGYFNGSVDDVQIYNGYAWTLANVQYDYNSGSGREGTVDPTPQPTIQTNLTGPQNNTIISSSTFEINVSLSVLNGNLTNTTLFLWNVSDYLINNTSNLFGDGLASNTTLWNISSIPEGVYKYNAYTCVINLTSGYQCSRSTSNYSFTLDTANPYFSIVPNNLTKYYPQTLSVSFTANDSHSFGAYTVNDSRFLITSQGLLSTSLSLPPANYTIKITINDSVNKINYSYFKFEVQQNITNLSLSVSPSTSVTYPTATTVTGSQCNAQINCTLYRNNTNVSNPDIQSLGAGVYTYIYNTTGNENYSATSMSATLTVQAADTGDTGGGSTSSYIPPIVSNAQYTNLSLNISLENKTFIDFIPFLNKNKTNDGNPGMFWVYMYKINKFFVYYGLVIIAGIIIFVSIKRSGRKDKNAKII